VSQLLNVRAGERLYVSHVFLSTWNIHICLVLIEIDKSQKNERRYAVVLFLSRTHLRLDKKFRYFCRSPGKQLLPLLQCSWARALLQRIVLAMLHSSGLRKVLPVIRDRADDWRMPTHWSVGDLRGSERTVRSRSRNIAPVLSAGATCAGRSPSRGWLQLRGVHVRTVGNRDTGAAGIIGKVTMSASRPDC